MHPTDMIPYQLPPHSLAQAESQGQAFFQLMDHRRSVRHFSDRPVPRSLIACAIRTASTAPSGAHLQPWRFVAISDPQIKRQIRLAAEEEEYQSYEGGRMPPAWRDAIAPLGTNWQKPYLEIVPWIVVVFEELHRGEEDGTAKKNYYVKESVGLACGLFIASLHTMGLATLTHTPSPMAFLSRILGRPKNERPFILFPIGYPADDARVPNLRRKSLEEMSVWHEADEPSPSGRETESP